MIYPSHRNAPDFAINMMTSMRCASEGIKLNDDLTNFKFCPSIRSLYSTHKKPGSTYLRQFHALLPHIAASGYSPSTPAADRDSHLTTRTSPSSKRSYIKKFCNNQILEELYAEIGTNHPEHLAHMASMSAPF